MCPHTAIHVSSYCYTCVLMPLYMCPHTAICVSSYCYICVLKLLHMCPHTAMYVSYTIPAALCKGYMIYVSDVCWRMLDVCLTYADVCPPPSAKVIWYMCPHTTIYVSWRMLTYADVCWCMLTYADVCWRMLTSDRTCLWARGTRLWSASSGRWICVPRGIYIYIYLLQILIKKKNLWDGCVCQEVCTQFTIQFNCFTMKKVQILTQKALQVCLHVRAWRRGTRRWRMLTYADVCRRMLTYADVCWRMLTYADVCWRMVQVCLHVRAWRRGTLQIHRRWSPRYSREV
jgi:hypothetical protein